MIRTVKHQLKSKWHQWLKGNIAKGLTRVYGQTNGTLPTIDLNGKQQPKFIIFSDQHRGARNGADDFQRSERAYNAALAYYYEMGYTLIALGDVEELWEERLAPVLEKYEHALSLEVKFHQDGRYARVFGNHDDIWQSARKVDKYLQPAFGKTPLTVYEGLTIPVQMGDQAMGEFFLTHGHQGSLESDYLTQFSRFWVRNLWRPLQRLTKVRLNTPASDWKLRNMTNIAMHDWAKKQDDLVLITGHTHYPVFKSQTHEDQLRKKITSVTEDSSLTTSQKRVQIADLAAKLEWVRATQGESRIGKDQERLPPCYFNSGCCSYADGDITGLEIADGEIRLVRWPGDMGEAHSKTLATADLEELFPKLLVSAQANAPMNERDLQALPADG